jgi:hypothetical protein
MPLSYFAIYDPQQRAKHYGYSVATPSPECLNAIREGDWVATEAEYLGCQRLKCTGLCETLWFEVLSVSSESLQGRMKVPLNWPDPRFDVVIELSKSQIVDVRFADFGKPEKHPSPQITSEIQTNNANGLPYLPSLREWAEVAEAARSRWLSSPSNLKLLAKVAELPPFSISQTPPGGWPKSCEPVSYDQARFACLFGNRPVLARYFRETKKVSLKIVLLFVDRLDPSLASEQAARYEIRSRKRGRPNFPCLLDLNLPEIADLLDPTPDQKWEIRFIGPKGNTPKALCWPTFFRMEVARAKRGERGKLKEAVYDVGKEAKCERAQVFRDAKACKEFWGSLKSILEELGVDETQLPQQIACADGSLSNFVALADRIIVALANRLEFERTPEA